MSTEIEGVKKNFPKGLIPEIILKFLTYCAANGDGGIIDYETIGPDCKKYMLHLIKENVADEFICFYVDNSHSCFAIWLHDKKQKIENSPVVIFDSEGMISVVSSDFEEFILLFSKTLLRKIVSSWVNYLENPPSRRNINPHERYTSENLGIQEEEIIKLYPKAYPKINEWVKNDLKLDTGKDLVKIIEDAIKNHPNLREYLKSKNAIK